jgi:hypothetical protein
VVDQKKSELSLLVNVLARLAGYVGMGFQALVFAAFLFVSAGGVVLAGLSAPPPPSTATAIPTTHSYCLELQQFTAPYLREWGGFVEGGDFVSLGVLSFLSTQLGLVVDDADAAGVDLADPANDWFRLLGVGARGFEALDQLDRGQLDDERRFEVLERIARWVPSAHSTCVGWEA